MGEEPTTARSAHWEELADAARNGTTMLVGAGGTGKSTLARFLLERLHSPDRPAALVSADMGQPAVGVPTCLGMALGPRPTKADALWFIGDTNPTRNLLPVVVGTARLAGRAREAGAGAVLLDTTGLVDGALARVLKYHKALAAAVDRVVLLEHEGELAHLAAVLSGIVAVHRIPTAPQARDRSPEQRRAFRESCYRQHFRSTWRTTFETARLVGDDWSLGPHPGRPRPRPGTIVGLLDRTGFCLALGLIETCGPRRVGVRTPLEDPSSMECARLGRVWLDSQNGFAEHRL